MAKNEKEKINASKGTSTNLHPSSEQEGFRIPPPLPSPPISDLNWILTLQATIAKLTEFS